MSNCELFCNRSRAARAFFYADWAASLLEIVGLGLDCQACEELTNAKSAVENALGVFRAELIAKYVRRGVDEEVVRTVLDLYENGGNGDEENEFVAELYDGLFDTNLYDKASVFATRLDDALVFPSEERLDNDQKENEAVESIHSRDDERACRSGDETATP